VPLPEPAQGWRLQVGVDIVGVARVARLVTENEGIERTVFSERELADCVGRKRCHEHMAVRFAAKEAVLKAIGTGLGRRMNWTDVEIVRPGRGRPEVVLHGEVAAWAKRHGVGAVDVSLSHSDGLALAHAIVVIDGPIP
jgi:holo-[acyl-carrier protein] synthase